MGLWIGLAKSLKKLELGRIERVGFASIAVVPAQSFL